MCDENYNFENFLNNNETISDNLYDKIFGNLPIADFKETDWYKKHTYLKYGMLGQYNREYQQIQEWRKQ